MTHSNPGPSDDELTLLRSSICTCALPTTGTTSGEQLLCQQVLYLLLYFAPMHQKGPHPGSGEGL